MAEQYSRQQKLNNIGYLIKLCAAAVKETQPPEPTEDIVFEIIYELCKKHNIANTVFYAVEKLRNKPSPELYKKWQDMRNIGVHRYMVQSMEASAIRDAFNENSIDFVPIKGFPVCELYPKPDYRHMGDLDYLLRKKDIEKAGVIVKSMGYMPDSVGMFHHDEYKKPPLMVLELHHSMLSASTGKLFYDYYIDFFDKCGNIGGHEYKMSDEDFYIFELVHLKKHYDEAGTGIRSILDMYLINKKMLPNLDREYIDAELEKLELTEFSEFIQKLADKWFEFEDVDSFSDEEVYIVTSGVYGLDAHKFYNRKKGKTKAEYLKERVFPSAGWMKETYPVLKKYPWLLPFTYVHRAFVKSFKHRKDIKKEIKVTNSHEPPR